MYSGLTDSSQSETTINVRIDKYEQYYFDPEKVLELIKTVRQFEQRTDTTIKTEVTFEFKIVAPTIIINELNGKLETYRKNDHNVQVNIMSRKCRDKSNSISIAHDPDKDAVHKIQASDSKTTDQEEEKMNGVNKANSAADVQCTECAKNKPTTNDESHRTEVDDKQKDSSSDGTSHNQPSESEVVAEKKLPSSDGTSHNQPSESEVVAEKKLPSNEETNQTKPRKNEAVAEKKKLTSSEEAPQASPSENEAVAEKKLTSSEEAPQASPSENETVSEKKKLTSSEEAPQANPSENEAVAEKKKLTLSEEVNPKELSEDQTSADKKLREKQLDEKELRPKHRSAQERPVMYNGKLMVHECEIEDSDDDEVKEMKRDMARFKCTDNERASKRLRSEAEKVNTDKADSDKNERGRKLRKDKKNNA